MRKGELDYIIEKNEIICSIENKSYYWLRYDGIKKMISMNSYGHLYSGQKRRDEREILLLTIKYVCA